LLWQIYTFVLGFVLVFRCNLAYQRFWEGRTCLELMSSKWSDAALQTVIFDNVANKSEVDRLAFRARMLSLFSLLHATALAKLQDCEEEMEVLAGIDQQEVLRSLNSHRVKDQVFVVFTWVQDTLIRRLGHGGLAVPAPICTRLFQELSNGMLGFNNAAKIHDTPFPFPYAQLITLALMVLTLTCGVVMNAFVRSPFWATALSFVAIAGYYAINEVAIELEDPFGDDANDLPMHVYQQEYNNRLRPLLRLNEDVYSSPALDHNADPRLRVAAGHPGRLPTALPVNHGALSAHPSVTVAGKALDGGQTGVELSGLRQRQVAGGHGIEEEAPELQIQWVSTALLEDTSTLI